MFDSIGLWVALSTISPAMGEALAVDSTAAMQESDSLHADESATELTPGARVRVIDPSRGDRPLVGKVLSVVGDTLRIRNHDTLGVTAIRLDSTTQVELSTSHQTHAVAGAVLGGLLGLGVGAAIVSVDQATNDMAEAFGTLFGAQPQHTEVSHAPIYVGLAIGGVLGCLIGNGIQVDNWVPVSVPVRVALRGSCDPAGRFRVAIAFSPRRAP